MSRADIPNGCPRRRAIDPLSGSRSSSGADPGPDSARSMMATDLINFRPVSPTGRREAHTSLSLELEAVPTWMWEEGGEGLVRVSETEPYWPGTRLTGLRLC
eukprot:2396060-Rhodomonas_salina.5